MKRKVLLTLVVGLGVKNQIYKYSLNMFKLTSQTTSCRTCRVEARSKPESGSLSSDPSTGEGARPCLKRLKRPLDLNKNLGKLLKCRQHDLIQTVDTNNKGVIQKNS